MIEVYKILTCRYWTNVNLHLELYQDNITRGHSLKLVNSRCHYDLRKFPFSVRIVNIWNSSPASVTSANNVNTFKNRLDRFWTNQELIYDYKSSLPVTGIGPNSTWLVTSRLDTTRHARRVERVETSVSSVSSRAVPTWRTTNKL